MATNMLNHDLDFAAAPPDVRDAFLGGRASRLPLDVGFELYKYSSHALTDERGRVSPWWAAVEPLCPDDLGLDGNRQRAARLGLSPRTFARARSAVTKQWNGMYRLVRIKLVEPVCGFSGRCASQRYDKRESLANVLFIGGGYQLWIPHLTLREVSLVPS